MADGSDVCIRLKSWNSRTNVLNSLVLHYKRFILAIVETGADGFDLCTEVYVLVR